MPPKKSQLQQELRQNRPFISRAHELTIGLLRTAAVVRRELDAGLEGSGLSGAQYNVLRILRGAGPDGLPTLAVRERLIDAAPGVTRLVEKLSQAGLVARERTERDRRQVICRLTPAGHEMLAKVDPLVHAAIERVGACLSGAQQASTIELLDLLRREAAKRP